MCAARVFAIRVRLHPLPMVTDGCMNPYSAMLTSLPRLAQKLTLLFLELLDSAPHATTRSVTTLRITRTAASCFIVCRVSPVSTREHERAADGGSPSA